jgi:hypothetical protein
VDLTAFYTPSLAYVRDIALDIDLSLIPDPNALEFHLVNKKKTFVLLSSNLLTFCNYKMLLDVACTPP